MPVDLNIADHMFSKREIRLIKCLTEHCGLKILKNEISLVSIIGNLLEYLTLLEMKLLNLVNYF